MLQNMGSQETKKVRQSVAGRRVVKWLMGQETAVPREEEKSLNSRVMCKEESS